MDPDSWCVNDLNGLSHHVKLPMTFSLEQIEVRQQNYKCIIVVKINCSINFIIPSNILSSAREDSFTFSLNCAMVHETEDNYYSSNRVNLLKHRQAGVMTLTHHKLSKIVYFGEICFCYACIL